MALTPCSASETRLLVRCFPPTLSCSDKEEFLRHFGAVHVSCMPKQSKLRYCVFATFSSSVEARKALVRLHQLKVLGNRLIAVYTRPEHVAEEESVRKDESSDDDGEQDEEKEEGERVLLSRPGSSITAQPERIQPVCSFLPPAAAARPVAPPPSACYRYPPVSASIIANIAHTLACVPQFYTQVLHLMNKMSLPPPFGPVTPTPPVPGGNIRVSIDAGVRTPSSSSESGSELEEDENERAVRHMLGGQAKSTALRKPRPVKRRRFVAATDTAAGVLRPAERPVQTETVFDSVSQGKKQVDLSSLIESAVKAGQATLESTQSVDTATDSNTDAAMQCADPVGTGPAGFGTFAPAPLITVQGSESESDDLLTALQNTISRRQLHAGRLRSHELEEMSIFKNYSPGEPTCRLYVKNLNKQVTEEELRHVFGRFVDREAAEHLERFNIRLMQEGRMKGQAFITLANEEMAEKARKETNGYILHSKPLVVQFARSARAKT